MSETLAALAKGAGMGMAFGPIGALVGAVLGGAPGVLDGVFGTHLAGPNGEAVAKAALDVVSAVTGKAQPTQYDVAALPPDKMVDLKLGLAKIAADQQKQADDAREAQRANELATLQTQLADIQSARAHDTALTQTGKRNVRADMMLVAVCLGSIACIWALQTNTLNGTAAGCIMTALGVLTGCFKDAFGFEFGSSRSSEAKTGIIADLAAK